jgi:hypothetical protein
MRRGELIGLLLACLVVLGLGLTQAQQGVAELTGQAPPAEYLLRIRLGPPMEITWLGEPWVIPWPSWLR